MSSSATIVDVGSPPGDLRTFVDDDTTYVRFHGFNNLRRQKGEVVISPEFTCAGHKWTIHLYPGGTADAEEGYFSLFLKSEEGSEEELWVEYDIRLLCKDGSGGCPFGIKPIKHSFYSNYETDQSISGWDDYCEQLDAPEKYYFLHKGTLTIKVRISPRHNYCIQNDTSARNSLRKNILRILLDEDDDTADVAFRVKGRLISAHRVILKAQAPELAEMCESCSKENPMPVADVEPEIFTTMLKHVYGDDIFTRDLIPQSMSILKAARKYGFGQLKSEAEIWHVDNLNLTIDNVIHNLLEADGGSFAVVKKAAMDFILDNAAAVVASDTYSLLSESPSLMVEVMTAMANQLSAKKRKHGW